MKFLAILALIWIAILLVGASFGVLGKLIWIGLLLSVGVALWNYIEGKSQ